MLRKVILAVCIAASVNMSAGITAASAAPHGGHGGGGHAGGGHPGGGGGPHFSGGGHPGYRGGYGRGYGGGYGGGYYAGAPYGYGYGDPYGYDDGYDAGPAIAAGIIGTALGVIAGAANHGCWYHNHHRVCR
jgi:hypothetical protein